MMAKNWMIRGSTIYLGMLGLILFGLLVPFFALEWISPFIALFFYIRLKKQGRIKEFDWLEIFLVILYTLVMFIGVLSFGIVAFANVPWWKIVLVGMAADVFASILGSFPILGDGLSAILVLIMVFTIIGGAYGAILGLAMAFISLLPGPTLGANTLFLVIFKIVSEVAAIGVVG